MNHKWKLGTYFGIGVYVHWTFLLLLAWVLLDGGLLSTVFLGTIFACVVAHEYGHALMARHYGIGTQDITLYPIGGIASLRALPKRPREEIAVALAGPAVNVVIAFILGLFLLVTGMASQNFSSLGGFFTAILIANVMLAGFNLIPAFPMDGGRVLRAWLARKYDYATATDKAAKVGRVFALLFAFIAIFKGMPFFLLLAVFVYYMAGVERRHAFLEREATRFPWSAEPTHFAAPTRRDRWGNPIIDVEVVSCPKSRW